MDELTSARGAPHQANGGDGFRLLFELAGVGMAQADPHTRRLTLVNPKFCELTGYPPDELLGMCLQDLTHPDDRGRDRAAWERLHAGELRQLALEKRLLRKDGGVIWASVAAAALRGPGGEPLGTVYTAQDISERKRAEEALRVAEQRTHALMEHLPGGAAFVVGHDLRFKVAEGGALAEAGFTSADLVGRTVAEALAPELAAPYESDYRRALAGQPFEREHTTQGRAYLTRGVPLRGEGGEVYAVLAVSYDVTERKHAEERQAFLLRLSDALRPVADPAEVQRITCVLLGDHLGAMRTYYGEPEADDEHFTVYSEHAPGAPSMVGRHRMEDFGPAIINAARAGETVVIHDTRDDPRLTDAERAVYHSFGIGSFIGVPLVKGGRFVAALGLQFAEASALTPARISLIEEVAQRTWAAVERARAEEELRLSEQRLQRMVNVPHVGVLTFDLSGSLLHANDAFLEMVGYRREEFAVRDFHWRDFTPPEYVEASEQVMESLLKTGRGGPYEKEYFRKDGSRIWLMFVAATVGDGTIVEYVTDVSGRKRADAALRASEERYRTLFDSIDEGFCLLERVEGEPVDFRYLEANPAFAGQIGVGGVVGKTIRETFPGVPEEGFQVYARVWETGEPVRAELDVPSIGRSIAFYAFRVGDGGRLAVIFQDITERKRREANLAFLAEVSQALIHVTGTAAAIERIGEKVAGFFGARQCMFAEYADAFETSIVSYGWSREGSPDLRGVYRTRDFLSEGPMAAMMAGEPLVVGETQADARVSAESYGALGIRSFVAVPLVRGGEWRFQISVIDDKPRLWRDDEVELMREITARVWARLERVRAEKAQRDSEARMRLVADNLPGLVSYFDLEERHRFVNLGYEEWFAAPRERILGRTLAEMMGPAYAAVKPHLRRALKGEAVRFEATLDFPLGRRTVMIQYVPDIENGLVAGVYALTTDISERKRAEDSLKASAEAQRRFAADASHELRAPLGSVIGNLEIMRRYPKMPEEDRRQAIDDAHGEATRMSRLIHDLLELARGDSSPKVRLETLRLDQLLTDALRYVAPKARGHSLSHSLEPVTLTADPDRVKELVLILMDNALKYTPPGGEVRLELKVADSHAEIRVSDTGVGIAPADLKHVFERFYRADKARARSADPGGTGLGLSIAKQIVDAHGGEIHLESEPGKGTTATVRLPIR